MPLRQLQAHRPRTQILLPGCAPPSAVWCQLMTSQLMPAPPPGGHILDSPDWFNLSRPNGAHSSTESISAKQKMDGARRNIRATPGPERPRDPEIPRSVGLILTGRSGDDFFILLSPSRVDYAKELEVVVP